MTLDAFFVCYRDNYAPTFCYSFNFVSKERNSSRITLILEGVSLCNFYSERSKHFFLYSVIHNSIAPSKELCSKRSLGEVGVSLP